MFGITAAKILIRAAPRETVSLPVAPWARAYGLDRDPGRDTGTVLLLGPGPGFDRGYAMTTDLAQPVIIATLPAVGGPPCPADRRHPPRFQGARHRGCRTARLPAHRGRETLTIRALR